MKIVTNTALRRNGEPIPPRTVRPFTPEEAEAEALSIAEKCVGLLDRPTATAYAYKAGAYESLYVELYRHWLASQAEVEELKDHYYPWGADELPELPDADLASTES